MRQRKKNKKTNLHLGKFCQQGTFYTLLEITDLELQQEPFLQDLLIPQTTGSVYAFGIASEA